jgi:hypothetical protein
MNGKLEDIDFGITYSQICITNILARWLIGIQICFFSFSSIALFLLQLPGDLPDYTSPWS